MRFLRRPQPPVDPHQQLLVHIISQQQTPRRILSNDIFIRVARTSIQPEPVVNHHKPQENATHIATNLRLQLSDFTMGSSSSI